MNVSIQIDINQLQAKVEQASKKQLYRAGALMMRMARQKIRKRKAGVASSPGQPPYKHRSGANDFGHSILFAVDAGGTSVVIGPQRKASQPMNLGGTVPETLERGGRTRPGKASLWFRQNAPTTTSESGIASWLKNTVGHGPLFMGDSPSRVVSEAKKAKGKGRGKKGGGGTGRTAQAVRKQRAPQKGAKGRYRMVYYLYVPIRSDRQAQKAAKNIVQYFGYPVTRAGYVAPRPFMGPTLSENRSRIAEFWKNSVSG